MITRKIKVMDTKNKLLTISEVNDLVASNRMLVLAGAEEALRQIKKGSWIGGTIPYFMNDTGGCISKDKVFVTDYTDVATDMRICDYDPAHLQTLTNDRYDGGLSKIIIPGFSPIHFKFALEINSFSNLFDVPLMGWITGVDLAELGKVTPKAVNGSTQTFFENSAVVLHCKLPQNKYANIEIINLFEQGSGDVITFNEDSFSCKDCKINGQSVNLADYLKKNNIDIRLPLVANYSGAMINTSFQHIDAEHGSVLFYAPVLKNYEYRIARPVENYVQSFNKAIPADTSKVIDSCNCILNYLYSELEGKKTGRLTGPFTFGEIAYVLVNQTMVLLSVEDK